MRSWNAVARCAVIDGTGRGEELRTTKMAKTKTKTKSSKAARSKKSSGKEPTNKPMRAKSEFPNGPEFDKVLEDAAQIARARYYRGIRAAAKDILAEAMGSDDVNDRVDTLIHEAADSAVTYTRHALDIVVQSDKWTSIEDAIGEDPSTWGATGVTDVITKIAFYAYEQDLREQVEALRNTPEE
jgi:hypothetical protein